MSQVTERKNGHVEFPEDGNLCLPLGNDGPASTDRPGGESARSHLTEPVDLFIVHNGSKRLDVCLTESGAEAFTEAYNSTKPKKLPDAQITRVRASLHVPQDSEPLDVAG